jgi:hypothetical protein
MCRNIRRLYNVEPSATDAEIRDAALQFVRKVSGYRKPSRANDAAFEKAVDNIAGEVRTLLATLQTSAAPIDRTAAATKAKERAAERYNTGA